MNLNRSNRKRIKDFIRNHTELAYLAFVIAITLPLVVRAIKGSPLIPLDISYVHIINSLNMTEFNLYDLFIGLIPISNFIPFLLGVISMFLLKAVFLKLYTDRFLSNLAVIIFALNPFTIFMFTTHNSYSGAFLLSLGAVALLLYSNRKILLVILAGLLTSLVALINLELFFVALVFIFILLTMHSRQSSSTITFIVSSVIFFLFQSAIPGSPSKLLLHRPTSLIDIIIPYHTTIFRSFYDLGGIFAFSILYLFLAFVFFFSSKKISKERFNKRIFVLLFLLSLIYTSWRLYFLLPLSVYSSKGLMLIFQRRWKIKPVMGWTFLLIACLFLFQYGTQLNYITSAEPSQDLIESLNYIQQDFRGEQVITDPSLASITEYYSGKRVFFRENLVPGVMKEESFNDINQAQADFLRSKQWKSIKSALNETDTRYILITKEMTNGKIWEKEEGLLFLIRNSDVFVNPYSVGDVNLWLYIG